MSLPGSGGATSLTTGDFEAIDSLTTTFSQSTAPEMEDNVDWGDSPFNELTFPGLPLDLESNGAPYQEHFDFDLDRADHEQWDLPSGEPWTPHFDQEHARLKPSISLAQRSRIGVHLNRREPTRDDYSNFVLYQGSQKIYEAVFLKAFLSHALHPAQLQSCLSSHYDQGGNVQQYLKSVLDNANQIITKMMWNTHSRTVNLMANDKKEITPFWDFQQFDKRLFNNFSSSNTFPVVHMMNESWHRAFNPPSMVRYTAKQYPISVHSSPFEEIDEVTRTLFEPQSTTHTTARDRVVRPPSIKKPKTRNLPGAAIRKDHVNARDTWTRGIRGFAVPESTGAIQDSRRYLPLNRLETSNPVLEARATNENKEFNPSDQDVLGEVIDRVDEFYSAHTHDTTMGAESALNTVRIADSSNEEPTRLEALVASHGSGVLLQDSGPSSISEDIPSPSTSVPLWRKRLIEDHKRRLAERFPPSQQQPGEILWNIKALVDQAVNRGTLKPPTPMAQEFIEAAARKQEEQRRPVVLKQHGVIDEGQGAARNGLDEAATAAVELRKRTEKRTTKRAGHSASVDGPRKRRKVTQKAKKKTTTQRPSSKPKENLDRVIPLGGDPTSVASHSHPSKTLESHQALPPNAYFEKTIEDEKPVWRCGIKHAMGYYYNAGDRKNCPGCFTSISENPKLKTMDFYMPSRSHFYQPAPDYIWTPSKQLTKQRRTTHLSHNSIAKDAYWAAINAGGTADEARQKGVEAVEEHLRPKTPPREPTPEPAPEPIDLGPHPSGSKTMEHGQTIPSCHRFQKEERYDEFAWRCDVNHALGRYYLAGNVKSCPGCGSCKSGLGKRADMDFYLPPGAIVRQKAPELVKWRPRKPYKLTRTSKKEKQINTHNQICSKKYWEAVDAGHGAEEALELAVRATDAQIDAKNEEARAKLVEEEEEEGDESVDGENERGERSSADVGAESAEGGKEQSRGRNRGGATTHVLSLAPQKKDGQHKDSGELSDGEREEVTDYESGDESERQTHVSISSDEEDTSGSDSE